MAEVVRWLTPHPSLPLKEGGGFSRSLNSAPPPLRGRVGRGVDKESTCPC